MLAHDVRALLRREERRRRALRADEGAQHSVLRVEWGTWDPRVAVLQQDCSSDASEVPAGPPFASTAEALAARSIPARSLKDTNVVAHLADERQRHALQIPSRALVGDCSVDSSESRRPLTLSNLRREQELPITKAYAANPSIDAASHVSFLANGPPTTLERAHKVQQLLHHIHKSVAADEGACPLVTWSKYRFAPGWAEKTPLPVRPVSVPQGGGRGSADRQSAAPAACREEDLVYAKLRLLSKKSELYLAMQQKAEIFSLWEHTLLSLGRDEVRCRRRAAAVTIQKSVRARQARQRCLRRRAQLSLVVHYCRVAAAAARVETMALRRMRDNLAEYCASLLQRIGRGLTARTVLHAAVSTRERALREACACRLLQQTGRGLQGRRTLHDRRVSNAVCVIQRAFRCRQARLARRDRWVHKTMSEVSECKRKLFLLDMRVLERRERLSLVEAYDSDSARIGLALATSMKALTRLTLFAELRGQHGAVPHFDDLAASEQHQRCFVETEETTAAGDLRRAMLELRWRFRVLPPEQERLREVCEYRHVQCLEKALADAEKKRAELLCHEAEVAATMAHTEYADEAPVASEEVFRRCCEEAAARTLQRSWRSHAARLDLGEKKPGVAGSGVAERSAFSATQIQRVVRGHGSRVQFSAMVCELRRKRDIVLQESRVAAATTISRWWLEKSFSLRKRQGFVSADDDADGMHIRCRVHSLNRRSLITTEARQRCALVNTWQNAWFDSFVLQLKQPPLPNDP